MFTFWSLSSIIALKDFYKKRVCDMSVKIGRNDPCWCGSGKKYKKCHEEFDDKIAYIKSQGHEVPDHSIIKTPGQIEKIRESAKINIAVLDYVAENIKAGMTTQQIDDLVAEKTAELGGIPAPLNYQGYPKSVCTSINEIVCHGIPSDNVILKDGDIVNVDVSTILDGYFTMMMVVDLDGSGLDFEEINRRLQPVRDAMNLTIHMQRMDIFDAMHRI